MLRPHGERNLTPQPPLRLTERGSDLLKIATFEECHGTPNESPLSA